MEHVLALVLAAGLGVQESKPRELAAEPAGGAKPAAWNKASGDLGKAIDARNAAGVEAAARGIAAWDSAESAQKLLSAFLQAVKQLESHESADQKAIKAMDDAGMTFVRAYMANPQSPDTQRKAQQYLSLMKEEEELNARTQAYDAMVDDVLGALGSLRTAAAAQAILRQIQSVSNLRSRARLIETLGRIPTATSLAGVLELLGRSTKEVETLAAVRALRAMGVPQPEARAALAGQLGSEYRQIRIEAARALAEMGAREQAEAIVESLKSASGQTALDLNDALKALTGEDRHGSYDAWRDWWQKNGAAFVAGSYKGEGPKPGAARVGGTTFYGLPVVSNAVAFVVDVSGSMWMPAQWVPPADDDGKQLGLKLGGNLKIHVLQYELKKVIQRLPKDATVALVFFDGNVHVQGGGPARLTDGRRKSLLEAVDGIRQPGGMTNLWGALMKAHSYAGDPAAPSLKKDGIDTIYALTDGVPSVGISDPPKFNSRFKFLNRYTQVRVHTLQITTSEAALRRIQAPDDEGPAQDLLEALAKGSGGAFQKK